jgi:hypothetical protein
MPTYGTVTRAKPVLQVLKGWDPNNPTKNTSAYRVKSGVTILSGEVISAVWNAVDSVNEWVKGLDSGNDALIPYFAHQDSTQSDVVSANSLVGLSCLSELQLRTGYYKTGETYVKDTPLTVGLTGTADAGLILPTTMGSGAPIVGFVTEGIVNLLDGGKTGYPSVAGVVSGNVVSLQTAFLPNAEDAT